MPFPVDIALIQEEERRLGRKLPMDLRVRLHRENGGDIQAEGDSWIIFPVFDTTDRRRITRTANRISRETESARDRAGFPPGAIAVAENGGGDLLIVRDGSDEIELWDHETDESYPVQVNWG